MTWFSLICLLALTSSAGGRAISAYGSLDLGAQAPILLSGGVQRMIPKTILPTNTLLSQSYGQSVVPQRVAMSTPTIDTSSYQQQQQQQPIQQSYGAQMTLPRTVPMQSFPSVSQGAYGAVPMPPPRDQPAPVPVPTPADILCQGRPAEDVIPTENNRKFVICLGNGKGVEQECPAGLFYHPESHRCERTAGPLDDACSSQPCLNGGQCLSSGASFQCQCAAGFEGVVCELDARICQTQQPCGASPDVKCQSFRLGAALPYICIFQNGLAYGLNAQQIIPSPCQGTEGPQALAVSQNGFIMCDGQRLFVESCPGGTIWDDIEKACSWPDQQATSQEPKTLSSGYGYGSPAIPQQQPVQSYGAQTVLPQQTQMVIPKQLGLFTQSYGAQTSIPKQRPITIAAKQFVQPVQSYGAQLTVPQQQPTMIAAKQFLQPVQSYGAQLTVPQQQPTMIAARQFVQPVQSYGAQTPLPQQQQPTMFAPKQLVQPTQSYGAQTPLPQQQPTMIAPKQLLQPVQSYGAQVPLSQPLKLNVPKQLAQPTQSYGSAVPLPQGPSTISAPQDVLTLQPGKPYGAAEFSTAQKF